MAFHHGLAGWVDVSKKTYLFWKGMVDWGEMGTQHLLGDSKVVPPFEDTLSISTKDAVNSGNAVLPLGWKQSTPRIPKKSACCVFNCVR